MTGDERITPPTYPEDRDSIYRIGQIHFRLRASIMLTQQVVPAGVDPLGYAAKLVRELQPERDLAEPTADPVVEENERLKRAIYDLLDMPVDTGLQNHLSVHDFAHPAVDAATAAIADWTPPEEDA